MDELENMTAGRNDHSFLFSHPSMLRIEYPTATTALYDRENEETSGGKETDKVKPGVQKAEI